MPLAGKKRGRPRKLEMLTYIFEFRDVEPSYLLSINHEKYADAPYSEYASINVKASCIHPDNLAGRQLGLDITGRRDFLSPEVFKREPCWRPRCVGALRLPPSGGEFYLPLPQDSLPFIQAAILHKEFRFLSLWGPPLRWGKSLCTSARLLRSVDLSEY